MKSDKEILRWLKSNRQHTGGLTSSDLAALVTSVNLCNLISYPSAPAGLFEAYRHIVEAMQPELRHLAFHAIACELDWSHRDMIWTAAGLPRGHRPACMCAFEPGGSVFGGAA